MWAITSRSKYRRVPGALAAHALASSEASSAHHHATICAALALTPLSPSMLTPSRRTTATMSRANWAYRPSS